MANARRFYSAAWYSFGSEGSDVLTDVLQFVFSLWSSAKLLTLQSWIFTFFRFLQDFDLLGDEEPTPGDSYLRPKPSPLPYVLGLCG